MHAGAGGLHEHGRQTAHRLIDLVTAVAAIVISVASLYVAVSHGRTEEKLLAASSWPFLTFASAKDGLEEGGWTIYFRLRNSGVGPARVKWLRLTLDGRPLRDRSDLMARCCGVPRTTLEDQVRLGFVSQNSAIGVLLARETVEVLTWRARRGNATILSKLDDARHRLQAEACYCSVLDECWISSLSSTSDPRDVDHCSPILDEYDA